MARKTSPKSKVLPKRPRQSAGGRTDKSKKLSKQEVKSKSVASGKSAITSQRKAATQKTVKRTKSAEGKISSKSAVVSKDKVSRKAKSSNKKLSTKKSQKTAKKPPHSVEAKRGKSGKESTTTEPGGTSTKLPRKALPRGKRGKEPTTMEELLKQTGYKLKGVKRGDLVEGQITDISKRMVLVDIGSKTEGLVVDKEYEAAKEFITELAVGDTITVYVLTPENERGQILLSLKKAATDRTWEKFEEALKTGEIVMVRALDANRGGVIVRADSLQGFVPSSQFGKQWLGKMEEVINRNIQVRVIEVDREKNRLIFSEKEVSEAEELKQRNQALKSIKVGESYDGVVSGIMPFGVFVSVDVPLGRSTAKSKKVGKVEGLVHISEISWEKVENPNDHFRVGDKIKVKILGIDEASGKLNLSVKRLLPDPWDDVVKKYPKGKKVKGKVSRVAPFGAFVVLEPGVEGLLHISKIPAGEEPVVDSTIDVFVEQVDLENRRMSLGMMLTEVPVGYK